jgi:hypothetical protein
MSGRSLFVRPALRWQIAEILASNASAGSCPSTKVGLKPCYRTILDRSSADPTMRIKLTCRWVATGIAAAMLAAATMSACIARAAQVPAPDPSQGDGGVSTFYTWGGAIPDAPGKLLRSEPLDPALGLAAAGAQFRILYTSTDGIGGTARVVVSGAYFVPKGTPPEGGWKLLAWAHGTTGIADICAPSWNARSPRDAAYLNAWLRVAAGIRALTSALPTPAIRNHASAHAAVRRNRHAGSRCTPGGAACAGTQRLRPGVGGRGASLRRARPQDSTWLGLPSGAAYKEIFNSSWPVFQVEFEQEHTNGGYDAQIYSGQILNLPYVGAVVLQRR